jgi:branched-chain amino acid transport system permease protein
LGIDLIIYGVIIMVISAYEPRGLWGIIEKRRRRRRD